MNPTSFNFGPIARTDAGDQHDTINLASLSLHVLLDALTASTSAEEFIAWLWHDLYKPVFQWTKNAKNEFSWYHIPGIGAFQHAEKIFAARTGVREGLVSTHHFKIKSSPRFSVLEPDIISDQGDQVNLGSKVNYIQLSIAAEPALATSLVRAAIADAFIEVVTRDVAAALQKALRCKGSPIERVRFEFKSVSGLSFTVPFNDSEIWNKVGKYFDVRFDGTTFVMEHVTPFPHSPGVQFDTVFTADLTGNPLTPSELINNTISLSELLVLYQDSRTIVIAVLQPQMYTIDQSKLIQETINATRRRLDSFDVLTVADGVDYLEMTFDAQVEIRPVPIIWDNVPNPKGKIEQKRLLEKIVLRPSELIATARNSTIGRVCRITGTPFTSSLASSHQHLNDLFNAKSGFVDTEFMALTGDISPLAYFYLINSPNSDGAGKAGVPKRASLRGSFMLLAPASHVAFDEGQAQAIDRPLLDQGGRFANTLGRITLSRITTTTQEFTLFQQMSRRIIANLWQSIAPGQPLPLPYLGAIALTHKQTQSSENLLPKLKQLFTDITLHVYPFEIKVRPALEVVIETAITDKQYHAGKHTLLKTTPRVVTIEPHSTVPLLVDDKVQINVTAELFERAEMLYRLMQSLPRQKRKIRQSDIWLKLILNSSDPITAVFESAQATIDLKKLPKNSSIENMAFRDAEGFWLQHFDTGSPAQSWDAYEQQRLETSTTLEQFPAILMLIRALHDPDTKGSTP